MKTINDLEFNSASLQDKVEQMLREYATKGEFAFDYIRKGDFIFVAATLTDHEASCHGSAYLIACYAISQMNFLYKDMNVLDEPTYSPETAEYATKKYFNYYTTQFNNL